MSDFFQEMENDNNEFKRKVLKSMNDFPFQIFIGSDGLNVECTTNQDCSKEQVIIILRTIIQHLENL